jgi:hypothetical protein
MIRRAIWLMLGAAVGITGYRKLSRAARTLLPQRDLLGSLSRGSAGAPRALPARGSPGRGAAAQPSGRGIAAGTAAFVRDVRDGMTDYLDRHRDI